MRLVAASLVLVLGCSVEGTFAEPTPGLHRMLEQPRCDTYEASDFFADRMTMRIPPEGTIAYGHVERSEPPSLDRALLERGQDRFEIFCAPCHGALGDGETPIAEDMALRPPPSLHEPRIVALSDDDLYARTTEGFGLMPSYAAQLPPHDRWAVVAYVRALQLSQRTPIAWLPPGHRRAIEEGSP